MLEKFNKKISVVPKMIGLGEEVVLNSTYSVPQNSITTLNNVNQKLGLNEMQPTENTTCKFTQNSKELCKCPHCVNMAKNFLYLESLIRANYSASNNCNVCHSSLQYLQHVNKSIMKVFGNFDAVAEAAKTFGLNSKPKTKKLTKLTKLTKLRSKNKIKTLSSHSNTSKLAVPKKKHSLINKVTSNTLKSRKRLAGGHTALNTVTKPVKKRSKKTNKKTDSTKESSNHSTRTINTNSLDSTLKPLKVKKPKHIKGKTKNLIRKLKSIK